MSSHHYDPSGGAGGCLIILGILILGLSVAIGILTGILTLAGF